MGDVLHCADRFLMLRRSVDECEQCQRKKCAVELTRTDRGITVQHHPLDPLSD